MTAIEQLRAACIEAVDYMTHAPNWPLGTRIAKRKTTLAALRAALAAAAVPPLDPQRLSDAEASVRLDGDTRRACNHDGCLAAPVSADGWCPLHHAAVPPLDERRFQAALAEHDHALCYAGFMAFIRGVDIPETTEKARLVLVERMLKAEAALAAVPPPPAHPDLKYTVDRDLPCAICRVTIHAGEQVYRASATDPDAWQHVSHGALAAVPPLEDHADYACQCPTCVGVRNHRRLAAVPPPDPKTARYLGVPIDDDD